ncbi:MAG: hypothetical protein RIS94_2444 [Pseudomonadota bacterium]|jgi:hypothetical protein
MSRPPTRTPDNDTGADARAQDGAGARAVPYFSQGDGTASGYYREYFNELAETCEMLEADDVADGLTRLAEVMAPHMARFIEPGWPRKAEAATRLLQARAPESAAFALVPDRMEITVASRLTTPRVICRAVLDAGPRMGDPAFSQNARTLATGIVAAMLRAVAGALPEA